MTFAEKLVFLMKLTSTSNKQLALAVYVDPSFISLLRTARREAPKNQKVTRAMAIYFARKCVGNYQRVALSEAIGQGRFALPTGTEPLSSVIFDWLSDGRGQSPAFEETFTFSEGQDTGDVIGATESDWKSVIYYGNEGKREALDVLMACLQALDVPGTVSLSLHENPQWLMEDAAYLARLREQTHALLKKGFRVRRIAAPIYTAEQAIDSLTHMTPMHLSGQMESYCYPHLRDDVVKRTLIALPETIALVSTSIGDQPLSRATILTREKRLIGALIGEFDDFWEKCRPMTTAYSAAEDVEAFFKRLVRFEGEEGDGIRQSLALSAGSAPPEVAALAAAALPPDRAEAVFRALDSARERFHQGLNRYETIDIQHLASAEEVRAGTVPIPWGCLRSAAPLCYTTETYVLHLKSILSLLEDCAHYHAVFVPCSAQAHAMLVKDGAQALLLDAGVPLTMYEIAQPNFAEACRAYLLRSIAVQRSAARRKSTISRIRKLIAELSAP